MKAESEPTQKAVKKRKKKKNAEPKDEPAKLPAASPSSPQVKPSAGTASESQTKQDAVSEANAPLKGDGKGVAVSEGSAQYRGGDGGPDSVLRLREEVLPTAEPKGGVARGELERGGTAESTASAEGTAVVASDAEEEETSSVLVCPLR